MRAVSAMRTGSVVGARGPAVVRAVRTSRDTGAGTVLVLAAVAVVGVGLGLLGLLIGGLSARQGARAAADLAALAAAQAIAVPQGVRLADDVALPAGAACDRAAEAARRNASTLTGCEGAGEGQVVVTVTHPGPFGAVTASARAGPRE